MARIKKYGDTQLQNLSSFNTFIIDTNPNSDYFRITEFKESFSGGKNGFLIEGSEYLLESTEIKIEIIDVDGNPVYWEPGNGIPEYYEGTSKVVAVYIYDDTPIGQATITVLGELKEYLDADDIVRDIPDEWKGIYNVKWEKSFKVNKLLANEDKVRFYRRPKVAIEEISRPIFTATPTIIQQSGIVSGTPLVPGDGVRLSSFSLPSSYLLTITDSTNWSGSVLNGSVTMPNLGITFNPSNVITNKELIVSNPYSSNGLVASFDVQPYTASFTYLVEDSAIGTALSGSFAKINITDLTTFVGDVARVKVFRKSQSEVSDFQFVQEIALESNEILVDLESSERNQQNYGLFTPYTISNYWLTSSANLTKTFNQDFLYNSVKLNSNGANQFYTSKSIDISSGVEYTLDMNVRISGSISSTNYIKVYLQGTKDSKTITQEITTITSSNPYLQKTNINENIIADSFDTARLYFEVKGNDWYISDVSLRASQETSFSPDEITFIQPVQRNLETETFDFRFEFYDINNNYIPVEVLATKTFSGGNLNVINKSINLVPTSLYFQFDSGSGTGNPVAPTTILIEAETNFITGSITFTSRSFDFFNNEISASSYGPGEQYPGLLTVIDPNNYSLSVQNFTGSKDDIVVQFIEYTAAVEGVSDTIIITRVSDGKGGVNYEIRPYNGTVIRNSDASSSLEIQAVRIDGINELNIQSGLPLGKSDYKLFVQSGSTYITLTEASSKGFVLGLSAGVTGSGQLDYNARFNRDSIDGQRTIYLIPSSSNNYSASILTSLTLTDLQDGLDAGIVLYDADAFGVNPTPKLPTDGNRFIPTFSSATASFYKRGTFENPLSCSIEVYPSMSLNNDFVAEYWINYVTHSCDPNITIVAFDEIGNIIPSRPDAATYLEGMPNNQNRQLITSFTYSEPWTSASVNVDKLFSIIPDGLIGEEPISFEVNPTTVVIKANENGDPLDFTPSVTSVRVKQGNTYLVYDQNGANGSKQKNGTYFINIDTDGIVAPGSYASNSLDSTEVIVQAATAFTENLGSLQYDFTYQPYYTSSILNSFVTQSFTKVSNGTAARAISISATANVVSYDGDGVVLSPAGDITLVATAYNTTGSAYFQFFKNDVELTPPTSINFGGDTLSLSSGDSAAPGETAIFKVALRDGSGDINAEIFAEDQVTISGVQSGGSPYAVSLTNENSSIFADVYDTITFTGTGTEVLASKGGVPLIAVNTYSASQFDQLGTVIPNGQYRTTLYSTSSHITPAGGLTLGSVLPNPNNIFSIGDISQWNYLRNTSSLLPLSSSAEIVYEIDIEDGKAVYYKTQSLTVQYEGAIGPGLIMRGEWTGSIDYIYDVAAKRRDAVFREISGNVHYWGTTIDLVKAGSPPYTTIPFYDGTQQSGDIDVNGWQYLGQEDFFVAAKLAIFEESFVKNTINVGNNGGAEAFANIVLAGGRIDPYIAVGQTGTAGNSGDQTSAGVIGYGNPGIFMGTKVTGSIKTPMMSLVNTGNTRFMRWDGSQLELSGRLNAGGMKLGPDVSGSNDGLYINDNNYWYDTGQFKVGDATNFVGFSGGTLTVAGSINVLGGDAATQTYAQNVGTASYNQGVAYANVTASAAYQGAKAIADSIANGSYSGGTFISSTSVTSPILAGGAGYISTLFTVGSASLSTPAIYLDARNSVTRSIYIGPSAGGVFNSNTTPAYLDSLGRFSLSDKLFFDGVNLTINGNVTATSGFLGGSNGWIIEPGLIRSNAGTIFLDASNNSIYIKASVSATPDLIFKRGALTSVGGATVNISPNNLAFGPVTLDSSTTSTYLTGQKVYPTGTSGVGVAINLTAATGTWSDSDIDFVSGTSNLFFDVAPFTWGGYVSAEFGVDIFSSNDTSSTLVASIQGGEFGVSGPNLTSMFRYTDQTLNLEGGTTYYAYTWRRLFGYVFSGAVDIQINETIPQFQFNKLTNIVELTSDGVQVASGTSKYFKAERNSSTDLPTVDSRGWYRLQSDTLNTTLQISGSGTDSISIQAGAGDIDMNANDIIDVGTLTWNLATTGNEGTVGTLFIGGQTRPSVRLKNIPGSGDVGGTLREVQIRIDGTSSAQWWLCRFDSSRRFKNTILDWNHTSLLDSINNTPIRTFYWNVDKDEANPAKQIGIIAEELEAAGLEEFVDYDLEDDVENPTGPQKKIVRSIAKTDLIFVLWKAVQELSQRVKDLEEKIN